MRTCRFPLLIPFLFVAASDKVLRFKPEHESMLRGVQVISTSTPRWSAENRSAWGNILLPVATREPKAQQRRNVTAEGFDLSKFGMQAQFVPLPAVQLIWPPLRRIFWYVSLQRKCLLFAAVSCFG